MQSTHPLPPANVKSVNFFPQPLQEGSLPMTSLPALTHDITHFETSRNLLFHVRILKFSNFFDSMTEPKSNGFFSLSSVGSDHAGSGVRGVGVRTPAGSAQAPALTPSSPPSDPRSPRTIHQDIHPHNPIVYRCFPPPPLTHSHLPST